MDVKYRQSRTRGAVDVFVPFDDHRFSEILEAPGVTIPLVARIPEPKDGVWLAVQATPSHFNRLKLDWQAALAVLAPPYIR